MFNTTEIDELLRLAYANPNNRLKDICAAVGRSRSWVSRRLRYLGIPPRQFSANRAGWPDDESAQLREMWLAEDLSTAQIGLVLGRSKNAVIGKAYRMGLPRKREGTRGNRDAGASLAGALIRRLPDQPRIARSENKTCLWPKGEPSSPDFHFCGQPVEGSGFYCHECAAILYQQPAVLLEDNVSN